MPVIFADDVPLGYISNHLMRLVGENLDTAEGVKKAFSTGGDFNNLKLSDYLNILCLTASSANTGASQNLLSIQKLDSNSYEILNIASFVGNYLDIDKWSSDNFTNINEGFIA